MDPVHKYILFSGYNWLLKDSAGAKVGPGPNHFSNAHHSAWLDPLGHLHLTIRQQDQKWYCSELILDTPTGYGTYSLIISSDLDSLDKQAVLGMFTYKSDD